MILKFDVTFAIVRYLTSQKAYPVGAVGDADYAWRWSQHADVNEAAMTV